MVTIEAAILPRWFREILWDCVVGAAAPAAFADGPGTLSFRVIDSFCPNSHTICPYGAQPTQLVPGPSGSLYGVTRGGGAVFSGTVFRLSPNRDGTWTEKVLYNFCSQMNCVDGTEPTAIVAYGGKLYGTVLDAGGHGSGGGIFELRPDPSAPTGWSERLLHSFSCSITGNQDCLGFPLYLTVGAAGNLYGTTLHGPRAVRGGYFYSGAVFELKAGAGDHWSYATLYEFCAASGCADGAQPAVLVVDPKSQTVYGTTVFGGLDNSGTVFALTPAAGGKWRHEVIYTGGAGWTNPVNLIEGPSGRFFGTTVVGFESPGTVYELAKSAGTGKWQATMLHNFCRKGPSCLDGSEPVGLVRDTDGNLYGTAATGGSSDAGLVYELAKDGTFRTLHQFTCNARNVCAGGTEPLELIESAGVLYGTAHGGGPSTGGTIFSLRPRAYFP
jgi:uncharacterized repeat protein (TIGR03803 family)